MNVKTQFPTYEQCLQLRHLGLSQKTAFVYVTVADDDDSENRHTIVSNDEFAYEMAHLSPLAAPSVAEMGAMLKTVFISLAAPMMAFDGKNWLTINPKRLKLPVDKNEAIFRAQLLIEGLTQNRQWIYHVNHILDND